MTLQDASVVFGVEPDSRSSRSRSIQKRRTSSYMPSFSQSRTRPGVKSCVEQRVRACMVS